RHAHGADDVHRVPRRRSRGDRGAAVFDGLHRLRRHDARLATRGGRSMKFSKPAIFGLLAFYFLLVAFPIVWLFYSSLKPDRDIFLQPFMPPNPANLSKEGLKDAWREGRTKAYLLDGVKKSAADLEYKNYKRAWIDAHFDDFFVNSVIVTIVTV